MGSGPGPSGHHHQQRTHVGASGDAMQVDGGVEEEDDKGKGPAVSRGARAAAGSNRQQDTSAGGGSGGGASGRQDAASPADGPGQGHSAPGGGAAGAAATSAAAGAGPARPTPGGPASQSDMQLAGTLAASSAATLHRRLLRPEGELGLFAMAQVTGGGGGGRGEPEAGGWLATLIGFLEGCIERKGKVLMQAAVPTECTHGTWVAGPVRTQRARAARRPRRAVPDALTSVLHSSPPDPFPLPCCPACSTSAAAARCPAWWRPSWLRRWRYATAWPPRR